MEKNGEKCILDPQRDCLGLQKAEMLEKQMDQWKDQSRITHKEFFDRIRELEKSLAVQDQQYKTILEKLDKLETTIGTVASSVSAIEEEPAKNWKDLKGKILWAVVGGIVMAILAALLSLIGL